MTHPMFTVVSAGLLAAALALVEDRTPRERAYVAARMFLGCVAGVAVGAWLMRLFHG